MQHILTAVGYKKYKFQTLFLMVAASKHFTLIFCFGNISRKMFLLVFFSQLRENISFCRKNFLFPFFGLFPPKNQFFSFLGEGIRLVNVLETRLLITHMKRTCHYYLRYKSIVFFLLYRMWHKILY